jgi:glutamine amidotransferase
VTGTPGRIAVVDYGVGNLRSVFKALEAAGASAEVITRPSAMDGCAGVVLPGVGAFGDAAANLRAAGFEQPIVDWVSDDRPLLGICVGLQLLFDLSEEMGLTAGLSIVPGRVVRFDGEPGGGELRLKVPQIGWNQLQHDGADPLLAGVPSGAYAYFVHSYYCRPADPIDVVATTEYGIPYASVVRRGSAWGIQCHPEKSQAVGLRILANFIRMAVGPQEGGVRG